MRIKIATTQSPDYLPGDYFRVLWDKGLGGVMTVLAPKAAVWPGQELGPVFSQRTYGSGTFSGGAKADGTFANRVFAAGSRAQPMSRVELVSREIDRSGLYRFAIQSYDFLGNAALEANWKTFRLWVSTPPASPKGLTVQSYEAPGNALVFSFTPSRSL